MTNNINAPKENPEDMSEQYSDERLNIVDRCNKINNRLNDVVNTFIQYGRGKKNPCPKGHTKCTKAWKMFGNYSTFQLWLYVGILGPSDFHMGGSDFPYYDLLTCEWMRRVWHSPCKYL